MASAWYYTESGEKRGPVSAAELKRLAESGRIKPTDQVWKEGLPKWVPAGSIKDLFPTGGAAAPPPLPLPPEEAAPSRPPRPHQQPQTARERVVGWVKRHKVASGLAALLLIAVVAAAMNKGGNSPTGKGGGKGDTGGQAPRLGEEVTFQDSKWTVVSAEDKGNTLKPGNPLLRDAKLDARTDGRFVLVRYKVTNTTAREERLFQPSKLVDSRGREFKQYDRQSVYLPEGLEGIVTEALPAGLTKEFGAVFEVPADAQGLKFQTRALSSLGKTQLVELGF